MGKLIAIVGVSGVGKTTLARALAACADLAIGLEGHAERPFQARFNEDRRYALANQVDYLVQRADEERRLRLDGRTALVDGGLDLDFYGFTRLFHARGWLSDDEYALCGRFHALTRTLLPPPELMIHLTAAPDTIARRLTGRERINIASAEDAGLLNGFILEWLEGLPPGSRLHLDVTDEDPNYSACIRKILARL